MGTNGAGKSTILDAISFSLFGKAFRNINKPALVSSINKRDCEAEIEFDIGKKRYRVCRGLKPAKFEIFLDGKLIDQAAKTKDQQRWLEQSVLKLNYKTFCQVVVLGSASYEPFMELTAANRRNVVEDVLDIQIFSLMNVLLKQRASTLKEQYHENDYNINLTQEKISLQEEYENSLKKKTKENLQNNKELIEKSKNDILAYESKIASHSDCIKRLLAEIDDKTKVEKNHKAFTQYKEKIESKIKKIQKDIAFYEKKDTCPTCQQSIDEEFKQSTLNSKRAGLDELEAGSKALLEKLNRAEVRINEIDEIQRDISTQEMKIQEANNSISAINSYIKKLQGEIASLLDSKEDDSDSTQTKLKELQDELQILNDKRAVILEDQKYHSIIGMMLKDSGIKTRIIKQYLPIMNKLINKYLSDMDFFVNFTLDESFNETIKSRYRDEFTYASFSEGEKFRINVALLLTWREIAKMKNSASTNLLIMDEVFDSSLDASGSDDVLKLIKAMTGVNVFVISHKSDTILDKFDNSIRVTKPKNFSQLESS
jgi:DNA repair exonuclease SbcCD ATPase subunit